MFHPAGGVTVVRARARDSVLYLPKINMPTVGVHGSGNRMLPCETTAKRLPGLIKDLKRATVEGGPHNLGWIHPSEVNTALLDFLAS